MKILYNQNQLNRVLYLGIAYIGIGAFSLLTVHNHFLSGLIGVGLVFIAEYFYKKNRAFLVLTEDTITRNGVFKKQIAISHIQSVKYFAGDYVVQTADQKLVIDTNVVDKASQMALKEYFDSLKLENKTVANSHD